MVREVFSPEKEFGFLSFRLEVLQRYPNGKYWRVKFFYWRTHPNWMQRDFAQSIYFHKYGKLYGRVRPLIKNTFPESFESVNLKSWFGFRNGRKSAVPLFENNASWLADSFWGNLRRRNGLRKVCFKCPIRNRHILFPRWTPEYAVSATLRLVHLWYWLCLKDLTAQAQHDLRPEWKKWARLTVYWLQLLKDPRIYAKVDFVVVLQNEIPPALRKLIRF